MESSANEIRDQLAAAHPEHAKAVMARDEVVNKWCAEHGKNKDNLTLADVLAIRSLPEWQNPV